MTDEEWAFFERFTLAAHGRNGRKPTDHCLVLDRVFWIAGTGTPCASEAGVGRGSKTGKSRRDRRQSADMCSPYTTAAILGASVMGASLRAVILEEATGSMLTVQKGDVLPGCVRISGQGSGRIDHIGRNPDICEHHR